MLGYEGFIMKDMLNKIIKTIEDWGTMGDTTITVDEKTNTITIVAGTSLHEVFEYGLSVVSFCELSEDLKEIYFRENESVKEAYENELGDFDEFPEQYGCPSELEFDSVDEYREFKANFKDELEKEFKATCDVKVEIANEVEAKIYDIAFDYGYEVSFEDGIIVIHR